MVFSFAQLLAGRLPRRIASDFRSASNSRAGHDLLHTIPFPLSRAQRKSLTASVSPSPEICGRLR